VIAAAFQDIPAHPTALQLCCEHAQKGYYTIALTTTSFAASGSVWSLTELQIAGSVFGLFTPLALITHTANLCT